MLCSVGRLSQEHKAKSPRIVQNEAKSTGLVASYVATRPPRLATRHRRPGLTISAWPTQERVFGGVTGGGCWARLGSGDE